MVSKRVANSKATTKARYRRVRLGYHRQKMIEQLTKQQEQLSQSDATDEVKVVMKKVGKALRSILPKKQTRRHQSR